MKEKLSSIMRRAWALYRLNAGNRFGECLRQAWEEAKNPEERRYTFALENARASITAYLVKLVGAVKDVHDMHKLEILRRALLRPMTADGLASMPGKEIGLCKYAVRNA